MTAPTRHRCRRGRHRGPGFRSRRRRRDAATTNGLDFRRVCLRQVVQLFGHNEDPLQPAGVAVGQRALYTDA